MASFNQDPIGQTSVDLALDDFSLTISGALPVRTHENTVQGDSFQYTRQPVIYLDDLEDVIITDPEVDDRLVYDGTVWRNEAV